MMILDSQSCITYPKATSVIQNWQPGNPLVNELLLAALTTCLVYQTSKIVLDVALGQKKRGEIRATDLRIFVMISGLTFASILSSFGCRGYLAKRKFHGKNGTCDAKHGEERGGQRWWARNVDLMKYLILVAAPPAIQILAIYMTVESEKVVSFRDADFGGACVTINERGPQFVSNSATCPLLCANYGRGESPSAMFFRCYQESDIPCENEYSENKCTVILYASQAEIGVSVVTADAQWLSMLHIDVQIGDIAYRVENTLNEEQRQKVFDKGIDEMIQLCDASVTRDVNISGIIPPGGDGKSSVSADIECADQAMSAESVRKIAGEMLSNVTIGSCDEFRIAEHTDVAVVPGSFFDGSDRDLLIRRSSIMSVLTMAVATAVMFTLRLVVGVFVNNEARIALETVVKDHLGMRCCDSMLQAENEVRYNDDISLDGVAVKGKCDPEDELGSYNSASVDDMTDD